MRVSRRGGTGVKEENQFRFGSEEREEILRLDFRSPTFFLAFPEASLMAGILEFSFRGFFMLLPDSVSLCQQTL